MTATATLAAGRGGLPGARSDARQAVNLVFLAAQLGSDPVAGV